MKKINRRNFMQISAITGAAAIGTQPSHAQESCKIDVPIPPFELDEKTITDLHASMQSGELTSEQICTLYLKRIDQIDKSGPNLNAVIELNPDALTIAKSLDKERQNGKIRGPLHGIPVMLKDNIDTADKMRTSAGSLALKDNIASKDSFVAEQLRQAGAVILGKTNLSEWANFRSTRSTSGWSGRGEQTRNPYATDRNPCGSSSGSGVAVSANLCTVAIGTETDGSVVCPSSINGIVGIKPTLGLVSRSGIIPIAHSQDTAGPMARTVKDAATLLSAMIGKDDLDKVTNHSHYQKDYTQFCNPEGLAGARIGVARNLFGFHEKVDRLMDVAIEDMKKAGAIIVDPVELKTRGEFNDSEYEVLLYEFKADLDKYLSQTSDSVPVKSLKDIIKFNKKHADKEMPFFEQEIMEMAQEKGPLTDQDYLDVLAKNHRLTRDEGIDAVMNEHNLDALIAPTGSPAWPIDLVNGDHYIGGSSSFAAVSGYPNITVPAGFIFGLPVGISFFGKAWSEPTLIKIAYGFEQTTKHRQTPQFLPTVKL